MSGQAEGKAPVRSNVPSAMLEIDVTEGLRTLVVDSDDSGQDDTPQQPRLRQLSNEVPTTARPMLGRKAATAPPGALYTCEHIRPYVVRKAISERAENEKVGLESCQKPKHEMTPPEMTPPIPQLPQSVTPPGRSAVTRKMSNRNVIGRVGSKSKRHVWRLSPQASSHIRSISEALGNRDKSLEASSFSEKARVREAWERKKLDPLRTTPFVDFKSKDLPGTPSSMVATPRELYGSQYSSDSAQASPKALGSREESHFQPNYGLAQKRSQAKHCSLPLTPQVQRRGTLRRSSFQTNAPNSPEKDTVYIPGRIRIEHKTVARRRKGSIATLDPFAQPNSHAKRFSDLIAVDNIVCFFQELGVVVDESSEEGFDQYWLAEEKSGEGVTKERTGAPRRPFSPAPLSPRPSGQRHTPLLEFPGRRRLRSLLRSSRSAGIR